MRIDDYEFKLAKVIADAYGCSVQEIVELSVRTLARAIDLDPNIGSELRAQILDSRMTKTIVRVSEGGDFLPKKSRRPKKTNSLTHNPFGKLADMKKSE